MALIGLRSLLRRDDGQRGVERIENGELRMKQLIKLFH